MSADPAMESYIPEASSNEGADKRNKHLPGMGGIYNSRNLQTYHYAGNNPLKYTDPSGEAVLGYVLIAIIIFSIAGDSEKAPPLESTPLTTLRELGFGHVALDALLDKGKVQLGYGFYFDTATFMENLLTFRPEGKVSEMNITDWIIFIEESLNNESLSEEEITFLSNVLNKLKSNQEAIAKQKEENISKMEEQLREEKKALADNHENIKKIEDLQEQLDDIQS